MTNEMTTYLMGSYTRIEEIENKKRSVALASPMCDALSAARAQIINYTSLVIQGIFDPDVPVPKLPHSPLLRPLMNEGLPSGFLIDLIAATTSHDWQEFKTVFRPLLQSLVMEGRSSSIVDATYRPYLNALTDLCDIKIAGNNRPICQLLTEMVISLYL